jgi:hypothetical protein
MPLYYFVIKRDRKASVADPSGLELTDMDAAWEEATKTAGEMIRDLDGKFKPGSEWSIEIQDASHKLLRTATLVAASHE